MDAPQSDAWERFNVKAFGRDVTLEIGEPDGYGQFPVTLFVGGKERYKGCFTDKTYDDWTIPVSFESRTASGTMKHQV